MAGSERNAGLAAATLPLGDPGSAEGRGGAGWGGESSRPAQAQTGRGGAWREDGAGRPNLKNTLGGLSSALARPLGGSPLPSGQCSNLTECQKNPRGLLKPTSRGPTPEVGQSWGSMNVRM